jgi:hypothetical protein
VVTELTPEVVLSRAPSAWDGRALFAATAGVVLAILAAWLAFDRLEPADDATTGPPVVVQLAPVPQDAGDPLAEFASIELAGPEDVLIEAVSGDAPAGSFAADVPACDPMRLASPEDVTLVDLRPGPRGRMPAPKLCPRKGDAPMIYAAGPPTR